MEGIAKPGHSRKGGKHSDLEGGGAAEGGVEGIAKPGRSRKGGKDSDLEGSDEGRRTPPERDGYFRSERTRRRGPATSYAREAGGEGYRRSGGRARLRGC